MSKNIKDGIMYSAVFLGLAVMAGCSYCVTDHRNPVEIVRELQVKFEVKTDMQIKFKAVPGELIIKGIDGNEAIASMEVGCPDQVDKCAGYFEDLEFETRLKGNRLTVKPSKGLGFRGNRRVKTIFSIPAVNSLDVKMTAGEIDVSGVDVNELSVDMTAGDVDINVGHLKTSLNVDLGVGDVNIVIPEDSVREVSVDAGIGDASIRINNRGVNVPRSFLLGAQTHQFISNKGAVVWVDVNVGDIKVNLTK